MVYYKIYQAIIMGLHEIYDRLARTYYNSWERLVIRNPLKYYFSYARFLVTAQAPKISYYNPFEPEYTKKTVRNNAPIVIGMFTATFLLS